MLKRVLSDVSVDESISVIKVVASFTLGPDKEFHASPSETGDPGTKGKTTPTASDDSIIPMVVDVRTCVTVFTTVQIIVKGIGTPAAAPTCGITAYTAAQMIKGVIPRKRFTAKYVSVVSKDADVLPVKVSTYIPWILIARPSSLFQASERTLVQGTPCLKRLLVWLLRVASLFPCAIPRFRPCPVLSLFVSGLILMMLRQLRVTVILLLLLSLRTGLTLRKVINVLALLNLRMS